MNMVVLLPVPGTHNTCAHLVTLDAYFTTNHMNAMLFQCLQPAFIREYPVIVSFVQGASMNREVL